MLRIQALIQSPPRRAGDDRFAAGGEDAYTASWLTGQPLMLPSSIGLDGVPLSDKGIEGAPFTSGEREILQAVSSLGHLKESEEDIDR